MQGVRGMQVNRGRATAGHCRGDLLGDYSGFADSQENDLAFAIRQERYHAINFVSLQTRGSFGNCFGFRAQQVNHLRVIGSFGHTATLIYEWRLYLQAVICLKFFHGVFSAPFRGVSCGG